MSILGLWNHHVRSVKSTNNGLRSLKHTFIHKTSILSILFLVVRPRMVWRRVSMAVNVMRTHNAVQRNIRDAPGWCILRWPGLVTWPGAPRTGSYILVPFAVLDTFTALHYLDSLPLATFLLSLLRSRSGLLSQRGCLLLCLQPKST